MQEGRDWDRLVINRRDTTGEERVIGHTQIRKGGIAKVTGAAQYGADVDLPGQLYAAVARSPYPHARILHIDTQEAAALPGVRAVITGADCPTLFGSFIADQPIVAREKVRYQGEPVAAVAADTQETAREAARLIRVEYEPLPVVNDLETSMKNEVLVHEDWSQYDCSSACFPVQGTNIGDQYHLKKGDVEAGFAQADEIVESDFTCGMLQHTTIETHTATAQADPISGEIHVWVPAQSPFSNRGLIAKTFHVPMEKVRLTVTEIGGGFGGKYEAKCEPIAVALSLKAKGRPVKLTYGRDEEFAATVCRSPVHIHMKTGVKRDGTLTAQKVDIQWDAGAYVTTNPRVDYNAGFAANGPYKLPNAQVDAYVYMTNKTLGTAYRGFGVTEVATAHERQMDLIAERLGMDPLELRLKNVLQNGDVGITGEIMQTMAVKECLEAAAANIGWKDLPDRWTDEAGNLCGKGIACFNKLTGTPSTTSVLVKMNENGSLYIMSASTEMGQGVTTTLPQIAAETLGMDLGEDLRGAGGHRHHPLRQDHHLLPLHLPLRQRGAGGLRGHQGAAVPPGGHQVRRGAGGCDLHRRRLYPEPVPAGKAHPHQRRGGLRHPSRAAAGGGGGPVRHLRHLRSPAGGRPAVQAAHGHVDARRPGRHRGGGSQDGPGPREEGGGGPRRGQGHQPHRLPPADRGLHHHGTWATR